MLSFKTGVSVHGATNEIILAIMVSQSVYESRGFDCVVTSLLDGKHSRSSLHYSGNAIDLRTRHLPDDQTKNEIVDELRGGLTADYDVVLERDHIHVEYQPKR
ncbi:hypothetical protein [uncultured Marinobacter sp.]|uniref:hypothetical protein n=1 Tax=uncultured Marinobacter sp. TaxID=187379 RepID=UPI0030D75A5D|tara:strand:- start:26682 stop:26990 length:309 start_codon:yes stop_codon:yes gene_type:complete